MNTTVNRSKFNLKKTLSSAKISAAFFILFFLISAIIIARLFKYDTAIAGSVPLAESLDYQLVEAVSGNIREPLEIVVHSESVSKKETMALAKEMKKENDQEIVVFASTKPISKQTAAEYNEDMAYKLTIKDNEMETIDFNVYKDTQPDTTIHPNWDISDNVLDLVTGRVTIKIEMDSQCSKDVILSKAQALSEQILANNQESGVASVVFEIKAGEKMYLYHSEHFYTIGEYYVSEI